MIMPLRIKVCVAHRFVRHGLSALLDADDRFTVVPADSNEYDVAVLDVAESGRAARRLFLLDPSARRGDNPEAPSGQTGVADLVALLRGATPQQQQPTDEDAGRSAVLNPREMDVLRALARLGTGPMVADHLGATPKTIARLRQQILTKLAARNVAHAVAIGYQKGWLDGRLVPPLREQVP